MLMKQLSVFLKNNQGTLADLTQLLGRGSIMIEAGTLADTSRYGVFRAIVSDSEKALRLLQDNQYSACLTDVLCVRVPDGEDGVGRVLETLNKTNTDIEYLYMFSTRQDKALVLGVLDPEHSAGYLTENGFTCLSEIS